MEVGEFNTEFLGGLALEDGHGLVGDEGPDEELEVGVQVREGGLNAARLSPKQFYIDFFEV